MKFYYYFLFRVYKLYKDKSHETDSQAIFSATAVSTLLLIINSITVYTVANFWGLLPVVTSKFLMILFMIFIGGINHFLFVKDGKFLNYDFKKDRKGGFLIVAYITCSLFLSLIVGQFNRERIFKEQAGNISNQPRKESLEGKIRKWFE